MPPAILRERLAEARGRGVSFERAWGSALRAALQGCAEPRIWADAIKSTRAAWRSAYARENDTALSAFADRTTGAGAQLCRRPTCPRALPPGARGWCSPECRREGQQEAREREAVRAAA
jgi:hypothetical protein